MDTVQEKLQLLRAQLDHIPVLQQAEVRRRNNENELLRAAMTIDMENLATINTGTSPCTFFSRGGLMYVSVGHSW